MLKLSLTTALFLSLSTVSAFAHGGRTNSAGCHNDNKNGGYHCHNSNTPSTPSNSPRGTIQSTPGAVVISVGDGDTIRVKSGTKTITIRLGCIDAPETKQLPWGQQSANRLKQLLPAGQTVTIRTIELDRYGRTVGEVFKGNQSVNLQMVTEGQAVVYRQYLSGCNATQAQYLQSETTAKQRKLGFWNQANPQMPWDFRRFAKRSLRESRR